MLMSQAMVGASDPDSEPGKHRLFRAMVLMGSGLALGCGGVTKTDGDLGSSGGSSSSGGSAPVVGSGGSTIVGNAGSSTSGGSDGTAGSSAASAGTGGQPSVAPGPFRCPPAQWDCSANPPDCVGGDGYALPGDCKCDPSRPESASDCEQGQTFVCRKATSTIDGGTLSETLPFECSCVPDDDSCGVNCDAAFEYIGDGLSCEDPTPNVVLCGCAWVYLR
jgi:hypothetical protein